MLARSAISSLTKKVVLSRNSKKAMLIASSTAAATRRNISSVKFVNTSTFTTKQTSWKGLMINQQATTMMRGYATLPKGASLISMPALSPTMNTGNIGKWLKKEGDELKPGDLIVEVETDKSTLEFEFQEEGFLAKILTPEGSKTIALGSPIAILVDDASKISSVQGLTLADLQGGATSAPEPTTTTTQSTTPTPQPTTAQPQATPSAKPKGLHEITMPTLSPTMTKGRIGAWTKQVGDKVSPGDIICTVETDKATVDFEFQEEGYLAKIVIPAGIETNLGDIIAILVENKEDLAAGASYTPGAATPAASTTPSSTPSQQTSTTTTTQSAPSTTTTSTGGRVFASPLAKKVAQDNNVDLAQIGSGSGHSNRIVKADVEEFLTRKPAVQEQPRATTTTTTQQQTVAAPAVSSGSFVDIPVSNVRKIIADRLLESKRTIPHYYLTVEIEVDNLMKAREELNKAGEKRGFKLSVNDFLVKAAALSMKKVPEINSSWQDTFIRQYNNVDLSVAVQTDSGLITPIVFSAETKGLSSISNEVKALAGKARENKLKPHEFQGGTFTISNLGMFGIDEFSAIINPPQACILAVGKSSKKVVVNEKPTSAEDKFKVVTTMKVTLSCDHRVVDGAVGAQWLQEFKTLLENPLYLTL